MLSQAIPILVTLSHRSSQSFRLVHTFTNCVFDSSQVKSQAHNFYPQFQGLSKPQCFSAHTSRNNVSTFCNVVVVLHDILVMLEAISSLYPCFATWVSYINRSFTTKIALSKSFNLAIACAPAFVLLSIFSFPRKS